MKLINNMIEDHYEDLVDNASDMIQCVDGIGRFVYVNNMWMSKLGYNEEDITSMVLWDVIHPESVPHCKKIFSEVIKGIGPHLAEAVFKRKDGELLYVEGSVNCRIDNDCRVISTRGIFRDVTEKVNFQREQAAVIKNLKEKEDRISLLTRELDTVFNGTNDCMFLISVDDDDFRYIRNNLSHQRLTGLELEDIRGKTPKQLLGDETGGKIAGNYARCVAEGKTISYEEDIDLPYGRKTWLTTLTPVIQNGTVANIVGSSVDITDKRRTEQALVKSEARTKALLLSSQDLIFVLDDKLHYTETYVPGTELLYRNPEAFIGKHIDDSEIPEPAKSKIIDNIKKVFDSGKPERVEYYLDMPSGRFWFDAQISLISLEGKKEGVILTVRDITERIKTESALKDSEEKYRSLVENLTEIVFVLDQDGKVEYVTPNIWEISSFPTEEILGQSYTKFVFPKDRKRVQKEFLKTIDGHVVNIEVRLRGKDKSIKWVSVKAKNILDKNGEFRIQGVLNDITERKLAEEEVKYLSYHDALTGLHNRRYMTELLVQIDKKQNLPIAVITADVNGLKLTNDAYGHETGDELLKIVAKILVEAAGADAFVIRTGGDEFYVFLPQTDKNKANEIVDKIIKVKSSISLGSLEVSIAAGCDVKVSGDQDINVIISNSDAAMYKNKLTTGKQMRRKTIENMLRDVKTRFYSEKDHIQGVSRYTQIIAKALGLSKFETENARIAGIVHDIGKIALDDELLNKKGRLNDTEFSLVKRHPEISYQILRSIDEYAALAEAVLYHHERPDAKGYPEGITEIPVLSKILAVADAFEAMTGKRTYRKSLTVEEALQEIENNSGTQFDKRIADAFIQAVREGNLSFEKPD